MNTVTELSPINIKTLSYTSFVGLVNQWNVPPGAYNTLSKWRVFGDITTDSNVLEIACTTGFSSRELALATGCKATGIDISADSVEAAKLNQKLYAPKASLSYRTMDATKFDSGEKYSHIILGAALRFFPNPDLALKHFLSLLTPGGSILSCEFYVDNTIPEELVEKARLVFDITVTQQDYKTVMKPYEGLTLLYEDRCIPELETKQELHYYCDSTIEAFARRNPAFATDTLQAMNDRLYDIKKMSNDLRPYQRYNVLIHKRDERIFPHRYTELF